MESRSACERYVEFVSAICACGSKFIKQFIKQMMSVSYVGG